MYESETTETILKRMLARISSAIDKREGSIAYDATAPAAVEFELLYAVVDWFLKNTFADTAERTYLIERAKERGLSPTAATYAYVKVHAEPETSAIGEGDRFSYDDVNYVIIGQFADGDWRARCETAGTVGNKPAGNLIPIEYVRGLTSATLTEIITPGEDEEETETFRKRYLASFVTQAYGGNIQDYQEKVSSIAGVGGVKVEPVWNGGGTVRIIFTTSENEPPTEEFVSEIQEAVDPVTYAQQGVGIAPIDHRVTVIGASNASVNIGLHVTFAEGDTWDDHISDMTATIQEYFDELNATWQDTEVVTTSKYANNGLVIRISQIESRLLALGYIEDISHTTIDGAEENLELDVNALATIGTISNEEASS